MADIPKGAILQRDKETYAIVPRTPVGILKPEDLEALAKVARKYHIPVIKITSGQRFALVGMKGDDVDDIWNDLGMDVGKATELCLHYVQACPGTAVCKFGVQDSLGLGMEIEEFFSEMDLPAKVKIGVSGCPFCCGESFVRDIGMFGKKKGWTFIVGGSSACQFAYFISVNNERFDGIVTSCLGSGSSRYGHGLRNCQNPFHFRFLFFNGRHNFS